ncbi:MAG TPA: response regulator [Thermoanaerobaculia bacterium]|jgi:CheY-like chemotaxis protein|nr:response regulator [Thermoanaerobaculia bacterium]
METEFVRPAARAVLVVDDDTGIRSLLATSLRREGYTIHEARNGREALQQMWTGTDDLVLLDLMMPEVSGWDVLEQRRDHPALQKIPVIVISANRDPEISRVVSADICALLPKPFDLDTLHAIVKSCLAHGHGPDAPGKVG